MSVNDVWVRAADNISCMHAVSQSSVVCMYHASAFIEPERLTELFDTRLIRGATVGENQVSNRPSARYGLLRWRGSMCGSPDSVLVKVVPSVCTVCIQNRSEAWRGVAGASMPEDHTPLWPLFPLPESVACASMQKATQRTGISSCLPMSRLCPLTTRIRTMNGSSMRLGRKVGRS